MKKYKVKYATTKRPNKIIFGLWDNSSDWVKWKIEQQKDGEEIQFLMSYDVKTEAKSNPEIKIFDNHPMGSMFITEDYEEEEEDVSE